MVGWRTWPLIVIFSISLVTPFGFAGTAAFDLTGPEIRAQVTRGGRTLPISEVPNLEPGDRIWLKPLFAEDSSAHYLLITAFLQGPTNPPPEDWFTRADGWGKQVRKEGIEVTVPDDAQQALILLAPATGGDFRTLRSTVRERPGVFVRIAQDLNQASRDRMRLDRYLSDVRETAATDQTALKQEMALAARSLNIKLDSQCFDKPTEQQAPCLMHGVDQLVLDDGQHPAMLESLTSGAGADLVGQLSMAPTVGMAYYSPYVGAFMDVIRLMSSFHTAQYQYAPALALAEKDELRLRLNNPPSFRKPQTVLVAALPMVGRSQPPLLRAVDSKEAYCVDKPEMTLAADGAPLLFATNLGHDYSLHVQTKAGQTLELPARPDAVKGGFVVDAHALPAGQLDEGIGGILHGQWGFEPFDGPSFRLRSGRGADWRIPVAEKTALVVGREDKIHLESGAAACVESMTVVDGDGKTIESSWKNAKPDELEASVSLKDAKPGPVTIFVKQYGVESPDAVKLRAFAEPGHLDQFRLYAGDKQATLRGTRLDEVSKVVLEGVAFEPGPLQRVGNVDELNLESAEGAAIRPADQLTAQVTLKDGREVDVPAAVAAPRPKLELLSKRVITGAAQTGVGIRLEDPNELPLNGQLSFVVKSDSPAAFPRDEKVEVGLVEGGASAVLTVAEGSLTLQDAQTVMATLDPMKAFGASGFGALRFRAVASDGATGDWQPLATLVRLPELKEVRCPDSPDTPCTMSGKNLYLLQAVASDAQFAHAVTVPRGFAEDTLTVPRPNGTVLYVKLRDDPDTVSRAVTPVLPEQ